MLFKIKSQSNVSQMWVHLRMSNVVNSDNRLLFILRLYSSYTHLRFSLLHKVYLTSIFFTCEFCSTSMEHLTPLIFTRHFQRFSSCFNLISMFPHSRAEPSLLHQLSHHQCWSWKSTTWTSVYYQKIGMCGLHKLLILINRIVDVIDLEKWLTILINMDRLCTWGIFDSFAIKTNLICSNISSNIKCLCGISRSWTLYNCDNYQ